MTREAPPNPESSEEQILDQVRNWVRENFQGYPNAEVEIEHLFETERLVREIEPTATFAMRIAALTHDIERAFPDPDFPPHPKSGYIPEEYRQYQEKHSNRSAKIVVGFLEELGLSNRTIIDTKNLIQAHEIGGSYICEVVKSADSVSFFRTKVDLFISWIPEKRTWQEVKDKFDLMYNRIWHRKAKEIAKEFYGQAMALLEEKRPEEKGLEEERRQTMAEYRRLVEEHSRKHSATDEEIEALHNARDRVLALFSR